MTDKHWTDAKIPPWVVESIRDDLRAYQITAALAWPTEAKPEPLPFRWGEYDRLVGEPVPGTYWAVVHTNPPGWIEQFDLRRAETGWKSWEFRTGEKWTTSVQRGPLFDNERDAKLFLLWAACEKFAEVLMKMRAA